MLSHMSTNKTLGKEWQHLKATTPVTTWWLGMCRYELWLSKLKFPKFHRLTYPAAFWEKEKSKEAFRNMVSLAKILCVPNLMDESSAVKLLLLYVLMCTGVYLRSKKHSCFRQKKKQHGDLQTQHQLWLWSCLEKF